MKLRLVKASNRNKDLICDMLDEWYASGETIVPYVIRRIDYHDYDFYWRNLEISEPKAHKRGLVPDSTWFALDEERNIIVGAVNIRHFLNEGLLLDGGNIGDGIRPSERRKGYATEMIRLALEKCKELGIYHILMVCDKDNTGSAKSIRNNGGVLENEPVVDGEIEQRYWIDLEPEDGAECLRRMSLEEIPECVQVIRKSFQTVADEFGFTVENAPRFTAFATDAGRLWYQFCKEERPMYVYLVGKKIVGYYSLALRDDGSAELGSISVLPEYRHKGIGAKLMTDAMLRAKAFGKTVLKLSIVEENQVLRKWYESFGFVHVGTQKFDFFPFTCGYLERELPKTKYYRVHSADVAWLTKQPRGIFTAVWRLIDAGVTTEEETAEYWRNRKYFEEALPLPPYYETGNPEGAVTWFKDTEKGNKIWQQMTFYRDMGDKYGVPFYISECIEIPGEAVYEDEFQIAVKNQPEGLIVLTRPLS
jgi:predicted acetyltransferase